MQEYICNRCGIRGTSPYGCTCGGDMIPTFPLPEPDDGTQERLIAMAVECRTNAGLPVDSPETFGQPRDLLLQHCTGCGAPIAEQNTTGLCGSCWGDYQLGRSDEHGQLPSDGRLYDVQCARCGSSCGWQRCEEVDCDDGYLDDEDDEDSCDTMPCPECEGRGGWNRCLSSPDWCQANPLPGREDVPRGTLEWFMVEDDDE